MSGTVCRAARALSSSEQYKFAPCKPNRVAKRLRLCYRSCKLQSSNRHSRTIGKKGQYKLQRYDKSAVFLSLFFCRKRAGGWPRAELYSRLGLLGAVWMLSCRGEERQRDDNCGLSELVSSNDCHPKRRLLSRMQMWAMQRALMPLTIRSAKVVCNQGRGDLLIRRKGQRDQVKFRRDPVAKLKHGTIAVDEGRVTLDSTGQVDNKEPEAGYCEGSRHEGRGVRQSVAIALLLAAGDLGCKQQLSHQWH